MSETQAREIILVVDDSPETLGMLTNALEEIGSTVLVALGGSEALSLIKKVTPDVILMDCLMPGKSGFETCKEIKGNRRLNHIPVIFMTGLTETDNIIAGFKAGGVDYLTKPIMPDELIARMKVHIANARLSHSAQSALDQARRHLIASNADGAILWGTPQASSLLAKYRKDFNDDDVNLPGEIVSWIKGTRDDGGSAVDNTKKDLELQVQSDRRLILSYLGQANTDEFLIRIVEIDEAQDKILLMKTFELTGREAEVLLWVAHGKANRDIADILGISPRTINKHLEPIFAKLNVENRTSAAMMAARALWGD